MHDEKIAEIENVLNNNQEANQEGSTRINQEGKRVPTKGGSQVSISPK